MDGIRKQSIIGDILCELDELELTADHRNELKDCLKDILEIDTDELKHGKHNSHPSLYQCSAIALIKFAESTINALRIFQVISPQQGMVCSAIVGVVEYVCLNKVDSSVLKRFSRIQEEDFQARCLATCGKISQCISYMQGLPKTEDLDKEHKYLHLQLMASDVSVQTGLDELLTLGVKIDHFLNSPGDTNFGQLMANVRLYCCMATFRELFLLYRFAIQSTFAVDAASVTRVIEDQRTRDADILKFLYMPSAKTAKFFCQFKAYEWPIVSSFMDRRGLHTEDLSDLDGKIFQIQSVHFPTRCLSAGKHPISSNNTIQWENNSDAKCTLFQLHGGHNNVFTIYPCVYDTPSHVCDSRLTKLEVSADHPSASGLWRIQKVHQDPPNGTSFYVIRSVADDKKCFYASQLFLYAKSSTNVGQKNFWKLKQADHLYFKYLDKEL